MTPVAPAANTSQGPRQPPILRPVVVGGAGTVRVRPHASSDSRGLLVGLHGKRRVPDFDSIVTMRDLADDRRVTSRTVRIHRKNLLTKGIVVETGFWIGLAVAIPLSIVANLVTPAAQNWLATNGKADYWTTFRKPSGR